MWGSGAAPARAPPPASTPSSRACPASRSTLPPPPAMATTWKRSGLRRTTSTACVPTEPVAPSRTMRLGARSRVVMEYILAYPGHLSHTRVYLRLLRLTSLGEEVVTERSDRGGVQAEAGGQVPLEAA